MKVLFIFSTPPAAKKKKKKKKKKNICLLLFCFFVSAFDNIKIAQLCNIVLSFMAPESFFFFFTPHHPPPFLFQSEIHLCRTCSRGKVYINYIAMSNAARKQFSFLHFKLPFKEKLYNWYTNTTIGCYGCYE